MQYMTIFSRLLHGPVLSSNTEGRYHRAGRSAVRGGEEHPAAQASGLKSTGLKRAVPWNGDCYQEKKKSSLHHTLASTPDHPDKSLCSDLFFGGHLAPNGGSAFRPAALEIPQYRPPASFTAQHAPKYRTSQDSCPEQESTFKRGTPHAQVCTAVQTSCQALCGTNIDR